MSVRFGVHAAPYTFLEASPWHADPRGPKASALVSVSDPQGKLWRVEITSRPVQWDAGAAMPDQAGLNALHATAIQGLAANLDRQA